MSDAGGIVYVVDDDDSARRAIARLLRSRGLTVSTFASAGEFQRGCSDRRPACVVLDVRMPATTGPELHRHMLKAGLSMPVVFVTGHGDVPTSVNAMKAGAVDFLTKPYEADRLVAAVTLALGQDQDRLGKERARRVLGERCGRLTPREREVFGWVVAGLLNKQIAAELRLSEKTVKVHRGRVMQKMGARSLAQLVRFGAELGVTGPALAERSGMRVETSW